MELFLLFLKYYILIGLVFLIITYFVIKTDYTTWMDYIEEYKVRFNKASLIQIEDSNLFNLLIIMSIILSWPNTLISILLIRI